MTTSLPFGRNYAQRTVSRDESGRIAKEDKRRSPPGLPSIALVSVVFSVIDHEGDILQCSTLASGKTPAAALDLWKSEYPALAADLVSHSVLTAGRKPSIPSRPNDPPMGERVQISDPLLERFAKGMRMGGRVT